MVAILKVIVGSCPGQIVELRESRIVFGRHPSCQIVLDNAAVSRYHAQILESHGHYYLEDLRSRNGTQLNNEAIETKTALKESDTVRVCDFVFEFHFKVPHADLDVEGASSPDTEFASTANSQKGNVKSTAASSSHRKRMAQVAAAAEAIDLDASDEQKKKDRSSIIRTMDASSSSHLRLGVRSDVKLRAVLEISKSLGQILDVDEVLQRILDGLFEIFPQADEGFVLLKDSETDKLRLRAAKTRHDNNDESMPISSTIIQQALETGKGILSANASEDSRFQSSQSIVNLKMRSMICAPLVSKSESALGVIQMTTGDLQAQFNQDDLDLLLSVATQGCLAIENANWHQSAMQQRDFERELDFATQVQLGFLPNARPKLPGYEFFDYYEAAQRVGGDYFDYVELTDGRIAVAVADVAGKGVAAALLMARMYSSARYHLLTKPTVAEALTGLNGEIATSGLGHRFITCVMLVIDPKSNEVAIANAGHLAPMRRSKNGEVQQIGLKQSGMPLGIIPDQEFQQSYFVLQPGDTWLLYTDGISEAMRADNQIYGTKRLQDFLAQGPADVAELGKAIVADVEAFAKGKAQSDDMCLVCFQRSE